MIHKLSILVAEGQEVLLTHAHLTSLFDKARPWIDRQLATYIKWTVKFGYVPETETFVLYSASETQIELAQVTYDSGDPHRGAAHRAAKMMQKLWDRAFPLHIKMTAIQEQSQVCGEFVEWLHDTKGIIFAGYHEHTDACYDDEKWPDLPDGTRPPYCQISDQMLYQTTTSVPDLLHEFFGIDRKAFDVEKDRMLEAMRP
jgi:hypothetical protein